MRTSGRSPLRRRGLRAGQRTRPYRRRRAGRTCQRLRAPAHRPRPFPRHVRGRSMGRADGRLRDLAAAGRLSTDHDARRHRRHGRGRDPVRRDRHRPVDRRARRRHRLRPGSRRRSSPFSSSRSSPSSTATPTARSCPTRPTRPPTPSASSSPPASSTSSASASDCSSTSPIRGGSPRRSAWRLPREVSISSSAPERPTAAPRAMDRPGGACRRHRRLHLVCRDRPVRARAGRLCRPRDHPGLRHSRCR